MEVVIPPGAKAEHSAGPSFSAEPKNIFWTVPSSPKIIQHEDGHLMFFIFGQCHQRSLPPLWCHITLMTGLTFPSRIIGEVLYSLERFKDWCAVPLCVACDGKMRGFACRPVNKSPMPIPMTSPTPVIVILQPSGLSRTQAYAEYRVYVQFSVFGLIVLSGNVQGRFKVFETDLRI